MLTAYVPLEIAPSPKIVDKMASERELFRSTVADIIDFDPLDEPHWRTKSSTCPTTQEMITQVAYFKQKWDSKKESLDSAIVDDVSRQLEAKFFHHCNVDEDHGLKDSKSVENFLSTKDLSSQTLSLEEQETLNLRDAYLFLRREAETATKECRGLLEESMLREVNKIILRNIPVHKSSTKPGVYCNNPRVTTFNGETYYYKQPDDMMAAVCTHLDRFNSLFTQSMSLSSMEDKVASVFKSVAWLVCELLDLHPFSDGNGRLSRLLCCYVLFSLCPFPSPIYNMYSESSMQDFVKTLVDARSSKDRKPRGLTTMIIESNWATWKKLDEIEREIENNLANVSQSDVLLRNVAKDLPKSQACAHSISSTNSKICNVEHKVIA